MLLALTVVTGILYPGLISIYSVLLIKDKAQGSLLMQKEQIIGSELLAQKFAQTRYFWNRPSSIDYNPSSSGASNQGPTSEALKKQVEDRTKLLKEAHSENHNAIPQDLLFASGSGLDPHISPEAAQYQALRIAKVRKLSLNSVLSLIAQMTEKPQFGILGESRVNVLKLNLTLDRINP